MSSQLEIRDPLHGPISVSPSEIRIIDSDFVQRLRGIKQTGFAELAFPGATHNRYSHSLGAFHLAGKAFDQVFKDFDWKDKSERTHFRSLLRMAALLHDIGHGPLSHAIEQAMPSKKEVLGAGKGQATHEDYTELIVLRSSLTDLLKKTFGEEFPEAIISLVRNENRTPKTFVAGNSKTSLFPIFSSLISGEIDVDRMDYMPRDSLYCGISYGNFDRDWIFSNLSFISKEKAAYLALDSRAIYAFEDFLLSRYHLYLMVYLHHKSVIYDEMLYQFLQTEENTTRLPSDVEKYLEVDDHWLYSKLRASKNLWAKRIVSQKPYRMLLEVHSDQKKEASAYANELEAKLKKSNIPYFRSSSSGLLSKYASAAATDTMAAKTTPVYVVSRDERFASKGGKAEANLTLIHQATDLFDRYKNRRIIDRIYAEKAPQL